MARLIDADALVCQIQQEPTDGMYTEEILAVIAEQPTIEAAPAVHGRCKFCEDYDKFGEIVCYLPTENGDSIPVPLNHCPSCGARMDGGAKVTATPTTGSNYQSCKHCNSAFIGLEEYAECPVCGHPFEEVANG